MKFDATFSMNVCFCSKDLSAPASVANFRRFVRSSPKYCISLKVFQNNLGRGLNKPLSFFQITFSYLIIGAFW